MAIETRNPSTGKVVKRFEPHSDAHIDTAIATSLAAFKVLRLWTFEQRAHSMLKAADILDNEVGALARIMTLEMGKTFIAAKAEVAKCAKVCRYYAQTAQEHLADDIVQTQAKKSYRKYLPLGPVLAVMPWNYPLWQVFRFAAPALMAGNTGLLKHASNVPQCALAIEDILQRAGFPDGAFQTLLIGGAKVERVLRDFRVTAATLTGSEPAGASVARICGEEIKPTLLELGGSDGFIIMPSADIDQAVKFGTIARTQNNGQSCIAAKRFFIHADVYGEVRDKLKQSFKALVVGDPMSESTDIGPLVSQAAVEEVSEQVSNAIEKGAHRVCGAEVIDSDGYYFKPGILENIPKDARIYQEEIFAPVALLFKVRSLTEAIEKTNNSPFGLGSSLWTQNPEEMELGIRDIEAGATFINSMTSSHQALPFGGVKRSGYGRELASEGIRTFCNVKTVNIA